MEKFKIKISVICNCAALVGFAIAALASSSSRDVIEGVDSFVDGYNYGKSLVSDAVEGNEPITVDSIAADQPLVATNLKSK